MIYLRYLTALNDLPLEVDQKAGSIPILRAPRLRDSSRSLSQAIDSPRAAGSRSAAPFPWKRQSEVPTDHDSFSFAKSSSIV